MINSYDKKANSVTLHVVVQLLQQSRFTECEFEIISQTTGRVTVDSVDLTSDHSCASWAWISFQISKKSVC